MSTTLTIALFFACPLIGALCAIYGQYTRPWQILFGAVVGITVADVIFRIWSTQIIHSAMSGKAVGVVVWSTEIDWSSRVVANMILLVIALVVGGIVLLVRQFVVRPN